MYFVLADLSFNVWRGPNNDHEKYNVFGLNDMNDMTKILEEIMKLGARRRVFCSILPAAF